jgi:hypothetical protein
MGVSVATVNLVPQSAPSLVDPRPPGIESEASRLAVVELSEFNLGAREGLA